MDVTVRVACVSFGMVASSESDAATGPELPGESVTERAANRNFTVPGDVHVASIVKLVPLEADTETAQPDAVPDVEKSDAERPLIVFDAVSENCMTNELASDGVPPHDTVGATVSIDTDVDADVLVGPLFAFKSVTEFEARVGMTVPSVVHVAVTVNVVPLDVSGENEHVAVPAFEKSALVRPDTDSPNVRPNDSVRFLVGDVGGVHDDTVGAVVSGIQRTITMPLPPLPPG